MESRWSLDLRLWCRQQLLCVPFVLFLHITNVSLFSVGKPISVAQTPSPSSEDIESLHEVYLEHLTELFELHKHAYGLQEHQHLTFIWPLLVCLFVCLCVIKWPQRGLTGDHGPWNHSDVKLIDWFWFSKHKALISLLESIINLIFQFLNLSEVLDLRKKHSYWLIDRWTSLPQDGGQPGMESCWGNQVFTSIQTDPN